MLYCPKCQQTYEEADSRFCPNDDERLLPVASSDKSTKQSDGVFTAILNRKTEQEDDKFSVPARFPKTRPSNVSSQSFRPPVDSKIFTVDPDEVELEIEPLPLKPLPPFSLLDEIKERQERFADYQSEEPNRADLTTDEPEYQISDEDDESIEQSEPDAFSSLNASANDDQNIEEAEAEETGVYVSEEIPDDDEPIVEVSADEEADENFTEESFAGEQETLPQTDDSLVPDVADLDEPTGEQPENDAPAVEAKTVRDYLQRDGQFNAVRAARIIRQAADALDESHQDGILHRNLKPENITLSIDENGAERVALENFGSATEKLDEENLPYKSPEQVEGKEASFSGDVYSLAVIAYQMLTNQLPFNPASVGDLLKAQREGLTVRPSNLRSDIPETIDEILEKALAFNASDRYWEVREFGDEFFSEIIINAPLDAEEETEETTEQAKTISDLPVKETVTFEPLPTAEEKTSPTVADADAEIPADIVVEEDEDLIRSVKATEDLAWEKRSPKPLDKAHPNRSALSLFGVATLVAVLVGVWYYFINRPSEPAFTPVPAESVNQNAPVIENPPASNTVQNAAPAPEESEPIPMPRQISPPPDTVYFQNSRENLKGDAMKNFLGFSLYYPKDWKTNSIEPEKSGKSRSKFLDISKNASSGTPVEQMLVSYYNSKGTFNTDAGLFPPLVKETNSTLEKIVPNYRMISSGEQTINNGWRAYEVKFEGTGKTENGDKITLWGRRLFIPSAIRGTKNGYVITMLATSLSKDVKSADDVGAKGELATILETFEPNQNF